MATSPPAKTLYTALLEAQKEMPVVGYDSEAQAGSRRYSYSTFQHVVGTVAPVLHKHGLSITQMLETQFDEQSNANVVLVTRLAHAPSGDYLESRLPLPDPRANSQSFGSACSYGKRYSYLAICGAVCDEPDDDGAGASAPPVDTSQGRSPRQPRSGESAGATTSGSRTTGGAKHITQKQTQLLFAVAGEAAERVGVKSSVIQDMMKAKLAEWNLESSKDMDNNQFDWMLGMLKSDDLDAAVAQYQAEQEGF